MVNPTMTRPTPSEGPDPDLLRRLREFQTHVRQSPRRAEAVVPARGPLSGRDTHILDRLRRHSSSLADSLEQALKDLNDHTRLSYLGPSAEVRGVMRAAAQLFAPDDEVRKQPWYTGIPQGNKRNPSQSERIRYAVQQRGGDKDQVREIDELVNKLVAQIGRETYSVGSSAVHAGTVQSKARKLTGWVFAILDEILPE
jgi:Predicted pPIWI-associating nuclease